MSASFRRYLSPPVIALLLAIILFIRTVWDEDRISAWLFAPYLAWVAFATLLNASIVVLN